MLNILFFSYIIYMNSLYTKAINFLSISNPSNFLPYHGIDHLWSVYNSCMLMINQSPETIKDKELLIAALFHDYDHSGGKLSDAQNITNALMGVQLFHQANPEFDLFYVKFLISCTEYPYTVEESDLTIESKMLRDADMCYLFEDLSIVKLYSGLRKEFNQGLTLFLNNQFNFLSNTKFYIPDNQTKWENGIKEQRLKELNELKKYV